MAKSVFFAVYRQTGDDFASRFLRKKIVSHI